MKELRKLKYGEYFTLKEVEFPKENQVWIKDEYDRKERAFACYNFADTSKWKYIKGSKQVFDSEHFFF